MSEALVTQLSAAEQSHVIGQRREVQRKYDETLFHLALVKHVGNVSYGDEPMKSLKQLKHHDATFDTDIASELHQIELRLRQQKLEQQWRKEGRGQDLHPDEVDNAMQQWVKEQLEAGGANEVHLKLPSRKRADHGVVSVLDNKNDDYEVGIQRRKEKVQKNVGDRVKLEGRVGTIRKSKNGMCEVKWDKKDENGDDVAQVNADDLVLLHKGHPAMVITEDNQRINWKTAKWRHKSAAVSDLSSLFSHYDGSSPEFLSPKEDSRKHIVAKALKERRQMMMVSKPAPSTPRTQQKKDLNVQSKFRDKPPFASSTAREAQVSKAAGENLGLVFDPDTMCITEVLEGSPAVGFTDYRGMRITHVSLREDFSPFSNDEGVHSKEQLRKALSRATNSTQVALRFEPWTQRRAVEKKKREFREKLISSRDKSLGKKAPTSA